MLQENIIVEKTFQRIRISQCKLRKKKKKHEALATL